MFKSANVLISLEDVLKEIDGLDYELQTYGFNINSVEEDYKKGCYFLSGTEDMKACQEWCKKRFKDMPMDYKLKRIGMYIGDQNVCFSVDLTNLLHEYCRTAKCPKIETAKLVGHIDSHNWECIGLNVE